MTHRRRGRTAQRRSARGLQPPLQGALLPTVAESGVPGYEASTWYGVLAPARTPAGVIERLHGDIVKILVQPEFREKLQAQGFDLVGSSPEGFRAAIRSEIAKWGKVVRDAGIRPE
jgi:tripartite-type tricarboxylate transporter receptor subunit TctC